MKPIRKIWGISLCIKLRWYIIVLESVKYPGYLIYIRTLLDEFTECAGWVGIDTASEYTRLIYFNYSSWHDTLSERTVQPIVAGIVALGEMLRKINPYLFENSILIHDQRRRDCRG